MRARAGWGCVAIAVVFAAACTPAAHGPDTRYRIAVEARARFERGELRPAQRALAELAREARDPVSFVNLGVVEFRRGKHAAAERAWTSALEFDPRHARAHYWLGVAARERAAREPETRQANLEAAAAALESAANSDPASAAIQDLLATTYRELGRSDDEKRVREELRRLDPAGIAVAIGAAELSAIVLPQRPLSAGGRVPLTFRSERLAVRATGVAACDVDADGRADLVLEGTSTVLRADSINGGAGSVHFTAADLGEIGRIISTVALLADRDQRVDLVLFTEPVAAEAVTPQELADAAAGTAARRGGGGAGARGRRPPVAPPVRFETQVWLLRGGVAGSPRQVATVDAVVRSAAVADVDRDGDTDLVVATNVAPGVRVWYNDGNGQFDIGRTTPGLESLPPVRRALCSDFNDDGRSDIVSVDAVGRMRVFVQGSAGAFVESTRNAGLANERARTLEATDLDGDGRLDLLAGNDQGLWVFANRGSARFARSAAYRAPQTAYAYGRRGGTGVVGLMRLDIDNDGGEDVLTLHPVTGAAMPALVVAAVDPAPRNGATKGAVVEDAAPELPLPIAREAVTLALWRATGAGVLQGLDDRFDDATALSGSVATADFDLDGDLDLACVRADSVVVVHWNEGGAANRRLQVQVTGVGGTQTAVGARIEVHAADLVRVADVSLPNVWIGARNLERLDLVRIAWPNAKVDNWLDVEIPSDGRLQFTPTSAR